jgi:serine/threonine-protein kinase PknG
MESCRRPGCLGQIEDGYCDHCGHQPALRVPEVVVPVTANGPDEGEGYTSGEVRCARSGCSGTVLDGYCDHCGLAPVVTGDAYPVSGDATPSGPGTSGTTNTSIIARTPTSEPSSGATGHTAGRQSTRGNLGAGLVEVPSIDTRDPLSDVLTDPEVPERKRTCARCSEPVGRSHDGQPGRADGFCTHCGAAYSFTPKLWSGDLVAGQYQVAGCIAHGGLGWIYLARDKNVSDRWVVLKGLLDSKDDSAMAAAIAEQRFLAEVEHPNIVKIYNFVQHDDAGYIVMEYVGGDSLREVRNRHREQLGAPLPVDQAIAYVLEILPAFGYLHRRGLLFCDFKPDNVIQTEEQLRLIDLGGVRAITDEDSDLYGTVGYQAPEVPEHGASVTSDLYTVARTLAILSLDLPGFQDEKRHAFSFPEAHAVPAFTRYESFHHFLVKATASDPRSRFQSASEMSDQLLGVLRQVVGIDGATPPPALSSHFSGELGPGVRRADWHDLPVPAVDPTDPAAALLVAAAVSGPDQMQAILDSAPRTPELVFGLARSYMDQRRFDDAEREIESPETGSGGWRLAWWRGLLHLASDRPTDARPFFEAVAADLPGELAPRLALAVALEGMASGQAGALPDPLSDDLAEAGRYYELVASTDPSFASACFGLARVRAARGDRAAAIAALQRIPATSSSHLDAQITLVRLLATDASGSPPALGELTAASEVLGRLAIEPSVRLPLVRDLLGQSLSLLLDGRAAPDPSVSLTDVPFEEPELRQALEATYRSLAKLAPTELERYRLVDEANALRPRTLT